MTVTEKGTLESAENADVVCRVKAGSKGYGSTINWVIADGSLVDKGQLLMILDDSALQEQLRSQKIVRDTALAEKIKAEKDFEITVKENERLIEAARNLLLVQQITLEQYTGLSYDPTRLGTGAVAGGPATLTEDGAFRQKYDDLTGQIRLEESNAEQYRERATWADRMVKQKFMSPAQAQAEQSKLESSLETLRSLRSQRSLLSNYERRMMLTDFRSKVEDARLTLEKEVLAADATRVQADIQRSSKQSIYTEETEKLHEIEEQIRQCRIYAPQGGMVVYYKNESSRYRSSDAALIEQGSQVKEGQKLLRIPNLNKMQVNTKVHEAMVARIRGDVRVATGLVDRFRAGLLAVPDPFTRLVSQNDELMGTIRDDFRDMEYYTARKGQPASVRVDAMPDVILPGRVRSVAAIASQANWYSDVKQYDAQILIERTVPGLKPDGTAEVSIHVDGVNDVLTVPLQAVVGGAEMGASRKVFVKTPTGYAERDVVLGLYNEKSVEVRDGLKEGDEVVINPRVLLGDTQVKTRDVGPGDGKGDKAKGDGEKKGGDPSKKGGGGKSKGAGGAPKG